MSQDDEHGTLAAIETVEPGEELFPHPRLELLHDHLLVEISTELRAPLAAIETRLSRLRRPVLPSSVERELDAIQRCMHRIEQLVETLTDLSLKPRQLVLCRAPVGLDDLIAEAVDLIRPAAERRRIAVRFEAPEQSVVVSCDEERVLRVLTTLLCSSIRFAARGSEIVVRCGCTDESVEVEMRELLPPDAVEVRDYAPRGQRPPVVLQVARSIVTAHGGRLWVERTPGEGSRVRFTLPPRLGRCRSRSRFEG